MKSAVNSTWTPERVATLVQMWAEGKTAPMIAAAVGGITESGVLKMKTRLRLPDPPKELVRLKTVPHSKPKRVIFARPPVDTKWTAELVERMKELWADGLSASQIAGELGNGFTRNAVIGKVGRLGLQKRVVQRKDVPAKRHRLRNNTRILAMVNRHDPGLSEEPTPQDIPPEQRRTILELTNDSCRWPIGTPGTPDFYFCGSLTADLSEKRPYCPYHHFISHTSAPRQKAEA